VLSEADELALLQDEAAALREAERVYTEAGAAERAAGAQAAALLIAEVVSSVASGR
jgi:hypothetical protein